MDTRVRPSFFRERVVTDCSGPSLCEQSHCEAVDINSIVRRFARTGVLPPARQEPVYADVTRLQAPLRERMEFSEQVLGRVNEYLESRPADSERQEAASKPVSGVSEGGAPPT